LNFWSPYDRLIHIDMMRIFARIISNMVALYVASFLVPGFAVYGGLKEYVVAGLVLALLNMIVVPVLKVLSFPLMILTFGLFSVVINAAVLWFVAYKFAFISIDGTLALILATIVIAIVNGFFHAHD